MIDQNISNAVSAILAAVRIGIEWGRPWIKPGKTNDNTKISDQENTITKALGVLAENGLYAMAVFLVSCKNETYGDLVLTRHLAGLWQEAKIETGRILIPQGQEKANKEDMFGAIIIPKLGLELPIFTGSTDANLERGIAHMEGTSLPVGGESTHSVLAGHNGAVTNEWFTNIDQLTEGDLFYIRTLEQLLTYKVISSKVISPGAVSELYIQEGRDLVTLLTCTPNGSMRLIVTGERVLDEAWNTGN